jgi:hypothetical protein
MCERLDSQSFARSLSLLGNLMVKQRHGQSLNDYVHYMRQTCDDYNETYHMVDGSAAIHPHNLGLLMLRGISNNGPHGQAKQCVINAFDTNYLFVTSTVMQQYIAGRCTGTRYGYQFVLFHRMDVYSWVCRYCNILRVLMLRYDQYLPVRTDMHN